MTHRLGWAALALMVAGPALAQERDIFDYAAQLKADKAKRIVFVADTAPHGPRGNHEFVAGAIYLARGINAHYPNAYCTVHTIQKWPKDLKHADAVIVLLNHGRTAVNPAMKEAAERGAGFGAIHFGVEVDKGEQGNAYLKWMGGYFEPGWSVNPWWTAEFVDVPKHDVTRGAKPFKIRDEWYYHMRFVDGMKGVSPLLVATPPLNTVSEKPSPRGGNPDVFKAVKEGKGQIVAWAYDRPDGGRGFGFTGYHNHSNLGEDSFRQVMLNGCAWVAKLPIPEAGIPSRSLSREDLEALVDEAKLAPKKRGI